MTTAQAIKLKDVQVEASNNPVVAQDKDGRITFSEDVSKSERVRILLSQATSLSREMVNDYISKLEAMVKEAEVIASLSHGVPPGVQEIAQRQASELKSQVENLRAIAMRN